MADKGDDDTTRKAAQAELDNALRALAELPPGPERDDAEAHRDHANAVLQQLLAKGTSSNPIYTGGVRDD